MKTWIAIKTISLYVVLFMVAIFAVRQIWLKDLLANSNFLNWDAEHYAYIKDHGYQGFRVAFFPLFPLIWRALTVGVFGMVLINSIVFLISFYVLIEKLKITSVSEILLYLTIPGFIFFYLPYSESMFFLCSVIILAGLHDHKDYLVYIGLFLAILSRPAFTIFIPALIITEFTGPPGAKKYQRIGLYVLISLIGLFLVGLIQFMDTGEWFKFFSAQKLWGNHLQIPKLPLTSWAGGFIVKTDGFAFLTGILAGGYLLALLLKLKWAGKPPPGEVIFSLAYIGGITLSVLLFRGGSLFSLNRFIFATPFIIVCLHHWIDLDFDLSIRRLLSIFGAIFLFWLLFGSYVHIQQTIKYALLSLYVILIFTMKSDNRIVKKTSPYLLILTNFTFQIIFYVRFLTGLWVG